LIGNSHLRKSGRQGCLRSQGTIVAACAAIACLALGAWAQSALSPQETRGKQIYLKGEVDGGSEIKAYLGDGDLELSAKAFPCANCHGLKGQGLKEGGLQPPPINWTALTAESRSALTGRLRAPYNEAGLARAISRGLDSTGGRLHPGMPAYRMTAEQMSDLIAYLKRIGNEADVDPGLAVDTVKVGAALPMTGPLAHIGEDVKAVLAAYFAEVNSQGGIYGRHFALTVGDSRGEPAGTLDATRRLVEQDQVFALVGSFEPGGSKATNEFLRRSEVPLIGPVTLSRRESTLPNPYVFYLMPSFADQSRVLADYVSAKAAQEKESRTARLAVIYARGDFSADAVEGLKAQAKMHSMEIVSEIGYAAGAFRAASAVEECASKKPGYVFFFGASGDILSFAREMEKAKLNATLLSSLVMLGRVAFELPPGVASRTLLSYPAPLPREEELSDFNALMRKTNVASRHPAMQRTAYAAARVFVEAMKSCGRQTSRTGLVSAIEKLRDFRTGVLPPLTFGPNNRVGATGSYVVGIDPDKTRIVPLSEWLAPKERP
jgi:ABC-type branched-subunit amino acid transport system substrate-binding protein